MEPPIIKNTEWDLSPLEKGKSFEEKRIEWQEKTNEFVNKWKNRDDYLKDPQIMKQALDEYEKWKRFYGVEADEAYYYWLKTQQDQNNPELKAKFNKIEEFSKKLDNDMRFFQLKIGKIPKEKQREFLDSILLKDYKHFLERIFEKSKYWLSEPEEKIITLKSKGAYSSWMKMISEFISSEEREVLSEKGEKVIQSFEEIMGLMNSQDKKVRDIAAGAFNDILKKNSKVAEAEINSILQDKKVNDELRGYDRPDKSRHVSDDLDSETVDTIVETIKDKFDLSNRYYKLKSKLLGVSKLEYHERNVEYGKIDKEYSYENTVKLIYKVFNKLDSKFGIIFNEFVKNSQIDVYPKKGKRGGAFCVYFLLTHPVYVMLNHTNKLRDVETLAHEMGHAINDELIKEKQNSVNFATATCTAEVASTFMEDFVLEKLLKEADDETKLAIMMQKLNGDISAIMRQIACDLFQRELHGEFRKKGHLSNVEIGKLFQKHMSSYMGDYVEQSKGSENWWMYWMHIRSYFYNYQYASGLLISKALQRKVKEKPLFIEKVKEFLSTGTSKSPKEIFLELGIDITKKEFWEEGLKEVEDLLNRTEKLAKELGKI